MWRNNCGGFPQTRFQALRRGLRPLALILAISLVAILAAPVWAGDDWYVRPVGGSYGAENGTDPENAWNGFSNVVWGTGGVDAGDTLWIIGHHGMEAGSQYIGADLTLQVGASGTAQNPIIIRGDYNPNDHARIYMVARRYPSGSAWTDYGTNGIYYRSHYSSGGYCFENYDRFENRYDDLNDAVSWPAGSYFVDTTNSLVYVKPLNGSDPSTYNYIVCNGSKQIDINSQSWIEVRHIDTYVSTASGNIRLFGASNITIEDVKAQYAYNGIIIEGGSDNVRISNCEIHESGNGIYTVYADGESDNILVENCYIHDIIDNGAPDQHAIGFQGGTGLVVRNCRIDNSATGITGYCGAARTIELEAYGNFITNIWRHYASPNPSSGHGAGLDYHGTDESSLVQINFHHNVVVGAENCGARMGNVQGTGHYAKLFNNVFYQCATGYVLRSESQDLSNYMIQNNIIMNPTDHGMGAPVVFGSICNNAGVGIGTLAIDNNMYYPIADPASGQDFYYSIGGGYEVTPISLNTWKSNINDDDNSLTSHPEFLNVNGDYSSAPDFKITFDSPAKDGGISVGLNSDFWGTSIPQGIAPDIGIHEFPTGSSWFLAWPPWGAR